MVFLISTDTLKEDLKRFVQSKEKQTSIKHKTEKFEPEPFNSYEEQYYEANVKNYRIDNQFDKPNIQQGARRIEYKQSINYPNLKKDVKEWKVSCC